MSRFAPRARVLGRNGLWLIIYPSGRKREVSTWWFALRQANEAVEKEREFDRLAARSCNCPQRHRAECDRSFW